MALSLQDLDSLISDPRIPAIHAAANALPTAANVRTNDLAFDLARSNRNLTPAAAANPSRIPSVGEAPNVAAPSAIPSLDASEPQIAKPKESVWKKLEHGLATAGNVAGDVLAPGTMALIPGTQLNKEFEQGRAARLAHESAETGLETAQTEAAKAQAWKALHPTPSSEFEAWEQENPNAPLSDWVKFEQTLPAANAFQAWQRANPNAPITDYFAAELTGKPPTAEQDKQRVAAAEQSLANGTITTQDRQWLAGEQRTAKMTNIDPGIAAQAGTPPVPADFPQGEKDPSYIKQNDAWGKKVTQLEQAKQPGTVLPLYNDKGQIVGSWDPKTGRMAAAPANLPGTTSQGQGINTKEQQAFNKEYVTPAESIERSYQMFQDAYNAIQRGDAKTGAEDMLLLSQHLGTTFGQVKGSRMNRDLIQEHKDAIGWQDRIERFANNVANGAQLSPDQRREFNGLITNMRNLTWQMAAKEAVRQKQAVDFLPADAAIKMKDSKGDVRVVPGDQVATFLDRGAELAD